MKALLTLGHVAVGTLAALCGGCVILAAISLVMTIPGSHPSLSIGLALCVAAGIYLVTRGFQNVRSALSVPKGTVPLNKSTEDRLDELERLKRRDMVTPEEYAAKRQKILKDL